MSASGEVTAINISAIAIKVFKEKPKYPKTMTPWSKMPIKPCKVHSSLSNLFLYSYLKEGRWMIISYISKGRKKSVTFRIHLYRICTSVCMICPTSLPLHGGWGILGQKGSSVLIWQINNSLSSNDNSASGRNAVYHVDNQRLIFMTSCWRCAIIWRWRES